MTVGTGTDRQWRGQRVGGDVAGAWVGSVDVLGSMVVARAAVFTAGGREGLRGVGVVWVGRSAGARRQHPEFLECRE